MLYLDQLKFGVIQKLKRQFLLPIEGRKAFILPVVFYRLQFFVIIN